MKRRRALCLAWFALLAGCAVGPNYHRPDSPDTDRYTSTAPSGETVSTATFAGDAQSFQSGAEVSPTWWQAFGSNSINALVDEGLKANPTLEAAKASLAAAHELALAARGGLWPSVDAGFAADRQHANDSDVGQANVGSVFNTFNARVAASYPVDLFGRQRRVIESLDAQAEFQLYDLRAARLAIAANIVTTAITIASLKAQIDATDAIAQSDREILELTRKRLELGQASMVEVLTQQTTLDQTLATVPPLQQALLNEIHALAVLAGRTPSRPPATEWALADLHLPQSLPLELPAKVLSQRPDVQAQAALVHAASAQVGVATADLLPQLTITASYGSSTNQIGNTFSGGPFSVWDVGAGLTQPIFRGGQLVHQRRAAQDRYQQSLAEYQVTLLNALQNIAQVLVAIEQDAKLLQLNADASASADQELSLSRQSFEYGGTSYVQLLDAQRTAAQARLAVIQSQAARFADSVALYQALAGSW